MTEHNDTQTGDIKPTGEVQTDLYYIRRDIAEIKKQMTHHYVSYEEFKPVKLIAYGMVGTIMVAVIGGLMTLLIKNGNVASANEQTRFERIEQRP